MIEEDIVNYKRKAVRIEAETGGMRQEIGDIRQMLIR